MPTFKEDELNNLRSLIRTRRTQVTARLNRLKARTGVDLRGSNEDPRRDLKVVAKYNKSQLLDYLAEMNAFMSRSVGYINRNATGIFNDVRTIHNLGR